MFGDDGGASSFAVIFVRKQSSVYVVKTTCTFFKNIMQTIVVVSCVQVCKKYGAQAKEYEHRIATPGPTPRPGNEGYRFICDFFFNNSCLNLNNYQ